MLGPRFPTRRWARRFEGRTSRSSVAVPTLLVVLSACSARTSGPLSLAEESVLSVGDALEYAHRMSDRSPVSVAVTASGAVYVLSRTDGRLWRISQEAEPARVVPFESHEAIVQHILAVPSGDIIGYSTNLARCTLLVPAVEGGGPEGEGGCTPLPGFGGRIKGCVKREATYLSADQ